MWVMPQVIERTDFVYSKNWVVRSASEVEQNVVSVERILHYVQTPPEAPYEIETTKPSDLWPSNGEVEFRWVALMFSCSVP